MKMQLLEIGSETEQLGACKISLLLGVFTAMNQLEHFLRFSRNMLGAEQAVLAFHAEPYIWYSSAHGFKAFCSPGETCLSSYFEGHHFIDHQHRQYPNLVQHVSQFGVEAQRYLAFDLRINDGTSIGHALFFDRQQQPFNAEDIAAVSDFSNSLIHLIELKAEHAELKEMHEQQMALNSSQTKFFQIIAHDLRAPFHGLLGFSEVLAQELETLDESGIQNIAEYLHDTAQSTYNLLNWAMAEGGRFIYHPINFELKQSSKIVCDVLNSLAVKKNIQLIDQIEEGIKVYADINMITSVIQNLISNALKFTPTDGTGRIIIQANECEEGVCISVHDTGLGMSQAQMEQLFQQSVTVSMKGTAGEKGTGLGLVLCKRFIDLNQGQIFVDSKEGEGTTFKVILPAASSAHQALAQEPSKMEQLNV